MTKRQHWIISWRTSCGRDEVAPLFAMLHRAAIVKVDDAAPIANVNLGVAVNPLIVGAAGPDVDRSAVGVGG